MTNKDYFLQGVKESIPIFLGYLAVSFSFGILAGSSGLSIWEASLISLTNVTSAGQFAGLELIAANASYIEMVITMLIINLRYCLMSAALSQKFVENTPIHQRMLVSFGITDEIFGISVCKDGYLSPYFSYGSIMISVSGWVLGTFLGALSGQLLPARAISALSVALYGMFLAIILPPARTNRVLLVLIILSMGSSWLFSVLPVLSQISAGFRIILLTFLIAGVAAFLFPHAEEADRKEDSHES